MIPASNSKFTLSRTLHHRTSTAMTPASPRARRLAASAGRGFPASVASEARGRGPMARLPQEHGAVRTRQLITEIAKALDGKEEPDEKTIEIVAGVFEAGGVARPAEAEGNSKSRNTTKILLRQDKETLPKLTDVFKKKWTASPKEAKRLEATRRGSAICRLRPFRAQYCLVWPQAQ